ncbi:NADH:flavin oxidoreductase [Saccharibacillus sp. CPCC 101409]|uniref:NADH:flavin oxidoreductase n=1 Tax=Saccharibacillus sp. CPCC 101409 TaxID=3058041 RepID=UPI002671D759|nr:NADH:flavin oxidoreductase [Saccharibacillus sp. CPCC 101409]MDO3411545.1 NADH:flavin oxidoreductase [Saccharibacillus sp. CPCC 101409]
MKTNENLLSTYNLGKLTLKNRVSLAPMTRMSADDDGSANDRMARYYERFAAGGFGLILTDATYPDEQYSQGTFNQPGIANEAHLQAWKASTAAVHAQGSKIILQVAHAGAVSQGNRYRSGTVAPSAVVPLGADPNHSAPKELSVQEIKEIIDGFVQAALRAEQAGFDGIELHGANGFLLDEFLTDYTNRRQDEYGGSTERRTRFMTELIEAVKDKVSDRMVVGIRISQSKINDFTHKWANGEKDAEIIFSAIGKAKADYIHITEYNSLLPAFKDSRSTLIELAKKYGKTTVIANGQLDQPIDASKALEIGADLVSLGKPALANHDWPIRVSKNLPIDDFTGEVLSPLPTIKDNELYQENKGYE